MIELNNITNNKIAFIGAGVVGLTTAAFFASKGIYTIITDKNYSRLELIKNGKIPFYEPKLDQLVNVGLNNGTLVVEYDTTKAIQSSDIVFITVGTPPFEDGSIDLTYIKEATTTIAYSIRSYPVYKLIIIKSTVVPTTTSKIIKPIIDNILNDEGYEDKYPAILVNPEFLREGSAVHDTINPHIIVIGSNNGKGANILDKLYRQIYGNNMPIIHTTWENAELIKYANNSFLATKISFINTIANICSRINNADIDTIANAIGLDPRIGSLFLKAGPGYGGSCLPKDVKALIKFAESIGYKPRLLISVDETNEYQSLEVVNLAEKAVSSLEGKIISILGLSFKKDTDDIRNSVSLKVIDHLLRKNAYVKAHDPKSIEHVKAIFGNKIEYHTNVISCLTGADCCIIMVDWDEYKLLTNKDFNVMKDKNVIDVWRILDINKLTDIKYIALGRSNINKNDSI
jgi:UDPglucose 6-dehydrogenase